MTYMKSKRIFRRKVLWVFCRLAWSGRLALFALFVLFNFMGGTVWGQEGIPEGAQSERIAAPSLFRGALPAVGSVLEEDQAQLDGLFIESQQKAVRPSADSVPLAPGQAPTEANAEFVQLRAVLDAQALLGEAFIAASPDSPFAPAIRHRLGRFYAETGRYDAALSQWQEAISLTQDQTTGQAIHDQSLASRALLMAQLGQVAELESLFEAQGDSTPQSGTAPSQWRRANALLELSKDESGGRLRGVLSLLQALAPEALAGVDATAELDLEWGEGPASLSQIAGIAAQLSLAVTAVELDEGWEPVVPSIVHMKPGVFVAIHPSEGGGYEILNPAVGRSQWLTLSELQGAVSGVALVLSEAVASSWRVAQASAADSLVGLPSDCPPFHGEDGVPCLDCQTCPPGKGGGISSGSPMKGGGNAMVPGGGNGRGAGGGNRGSANRGGSCYSGCSSIQVEPGMPSWRVSEPFLNVWVEDMPLEYLPARGPAIRLVLGHRQRDGDGYDYYEGASFGQGVHASWFSSAGPFGGNTYFVYHPNGRLGHYKFSSSSAAMSERNYWDNSQLERLANGFLLHRPDGSVWHYEYGVYGDYYLSAQVDPQGERLSFYYDAYDRLVAIQDAASGTTQLSYSGTGIQVQSVRTPDGRTAQFEYTNRGGGDAYLTAITDPVGIRSTIDYSQSSGFSDWIASFTTPYGTTSFEYSGYFDSGLSSWVKVTEPEGRVHGFALIDTNAAGMPSTFANHQVPSVSGGSPLDLTYRQHRNSFYWNPLQWAALGKSDISTFAWAEYRQARIRHWLWEEQRHVDSLSYEQLPSPDGTTEGAVVFYGYTGKPAPNRTGNQVFPSYVAWRTPEGETAYIKYERNAQGKVLAERQSVQKEDGSIGECVRRFTYSSDGTSILTESDWKERPLRAYTYNNRRQPTTVKVFPESGRTETNNLTYNAAGQLIRVDTATGLAIKLYYDASGYLSRREYFDNWNRNLGDETFTWQLGKLQKYKDLRRLLRTYHYDGLQRVTRIQYGYDYGYSSHPNLYGQETFRYTMNGSANGAPGMDLTYFEDRMGNVSRYAYNGLRQLTSTTDALGRSTSFAYCACGSLEQVIDALGGVTRFEHDQQGNRTLIESPGGTQRVLMEYDSLGRMAFVDDMTTTRTFNYNHQGQLRSVTGPEGAMMERYFDAQGDLVRETDVEGQDWTAIYDRLGRILQSTDPDSKVNKWKYDAKGLIESTDAMNRTTTYTRDVRGLATYQRLPGGLWESVRRSRAGDIDRLDTGSKTIYFSRDLFGRVIQRSDRNYQTLATYAYDRLGRLTRETKGWIPLDYEYDAVGNLLKIKRGYNSSDIVYSYDALNRLTSMTDDIGTTQFGYTADGFLTSETGPWSGVNVAWGDEWGRRTNLEVEQGNVSWIQNYGYDSQGRLSEITSPAGEFQYGYGSGASARWKRLDLPNSAGWIARAFDTIGRQTHTTLHSQNHGVMDAHRYQYDVNHRRTRHTKTQGNYWDYTYDGNGQLSTGRGFESNGTQRLHEQFDYSYYGRNLQYRKRGNQSYWGAQNTTFRAGWDGVSDELYWVSPIGKTIVSGLSRPPAQSVEVDGSAAIVYQDGAFAREHDALPVNGGLETHTVTASGSGGETARKRVPYKIENIARGTYGSQLITVTHDASGNMTGAGERIYRYDNQNQLESVEQPGEWRVNYRYDGLQRLRQVSRYRWRNAQWDPGEVRRYLYDGRQIIQEHDGSNNRVLSYTRGLDLSESLSGAGGIGGLLAYTDHEGPQDRTAYYHADGNGNITAMMNRHGQLVAEYHYDPYGNLLAHAGPLADINRYRFSSKQYQPESGIYYYGFRFYDPSLQRWINQDPIGEAGGINLYGFVGNDPVNRIDPLGLTDGDLTELGDGMLRPGMLIDPYFDDPRNPGNPVTGGDLVREVGGEVIWAMIPGGVGKAKNLKNVPKGNSWKRFKNWVGKLGKPKSLSCLNRMDFHKKLRDRGFVYHGTTKGGFVRYRNTNGSEVWIRPNGEVIRLGPKVKPTGGGKAYHPRVDASGNPIDTHNPGEFVEPLPGP